MSVAYSKGMWEVGRGLGASTILAQAVKSLKTLGGKRGSKSLTPFSVFHGTFYLLALLLTAGAMHNGDLGCHQVIKKSDLQITKSVGI